MDMGWPLEVMRTFCNQRSQWNNLVKVPKATELYALKWIISRYVNFISIKKKLKINVVSSENFTDWRMTVSGVAGLKRLFFLNQGPGRSEVTLPCRCPGPRLHHSQQTAASLPGQGGEERNWGLRGLLQRPFQELKIISWHRIMC